MPSERQMKELALSKIEPLIDRLAQRADEGDHQAARLLCEIAGLARAGAGRPATKNKKEYVDLTPQEIKEQTAVVDGILEKHGQGDVSGK